jgi:hypothetical protein
VAGPLNRTLGAFAASAGAATLTPALPAVDTNGNGLLLALCVTKNNATHATATSGWSLVNQTNSGASFTASLWKAAQGSAAPVFTWTGSVACSAQVAYYTDPQNTMDVAGAALLGAVGTGTTSTHASAGGNTTANTVDALYIDACAANTAMATPAGWTEDNDAGSATSATRHVFGEKSVATSGTASGAISVTGGNAAWVQFQVQIAGAAPTAGFQVSKEAVAAWAEPTSGLDVSKLSVSAWVETNDVRFSKMEVAAWLDLTGGSAGGRRRQIINC